MSGLISLAYDPHISRSPVPSDFVRPEESDHPEHAGFPGSPLPRRWDRAGCILGHANVASRVAAAAVIGAAGVQGAVDGAAGLSLVEATGGV